MSELPDISTSSVTGTTVGRGSMWGLQKYCVKCIVYMGLCVVQESLEVKAGIVTPGVALRNTGFVDRVAARGVKFELVDRVQGAHLD